MVIAMDPAIYNPLYIAAGPALGLGGWLLYWAGLPLVGGVVGASAGGSLGYIISGWMQVNWAPAFFVGVGIVAGGFIGVFLMRALQTYFFFLVGACVGGALAFNLSDVGPLGDLVGPPSSPEGLIFIAVTALVSGLLMVKLRRFIVALITAVAGAILFSAGVPQQWAGLALPVSAVAFLAIQVGLVKRFVNTEKFDRRAGREYVHQRRVDDKR